MDWRGFLGIFSKHDRMHHPYIDKYSRLDSFMHRIDPRVKIISAAFIIVSVLFTKVSSPVPFILYGILLSAFIALSKIPPLFILKRSLVVVPFAIFVAFFIPFFKKGEVVWAFSLGWFHIAVTREGVITFSGIFAKSFLSTICLIVFTASTRFSVLLKAFEKLKVPNIFIMIVSFIYRYIFVIVDELMHMKQAKEARSIKGGKIFHGRALANMIGSLFVKSYERAESVYIAMCSRGFNGSIHAIHDFKLRFIDIFFSLITLVFLLMAKTAAG
ncbi:MAG: cobalt ECF transporter T component CbiQ [Candidatus Omnitrophica bacterium]|nr:cobalt ECF transporter T component CbiQ [Candidatus Omnitrophota bacterium]